MKVYNSIPHLAGSNRGEDAVADKWVSALATGTRIQRKCRIYVSEKVDGSCTGVIRRGDELIALTRSGGLSSLMGVKNHVFRRRDGAPCNHHSSILQFRMEQVLF